MPLLENERDDAVRGRNREQVHHSRLERNHDGAEGEQEDDEAEGDDDGDHRGQLVADARGQVDVAGGLPPDVSGQIGALYRVRDHVVAEVVDEVLGLL